MSQRSLEDPSKFSEYKIEVERKMIVTFYANPDQASMSSFTSKRLEYETSVAKSPLNGQVSLVKSFTYNPKSRKRMWRRWPWFLIIVSCVQLLIFITGIDHIQRSLVFTPFHPLELWRYLSYMLLHSDMSHLGLNIILQNFIGYHLEREQGHWRVAVIYMTGGISGSLIAIVLQSKLPLMGASAGVYALLTSHVPHLWKNYSQLSHRSIRIAAVVLLILSDISQTSYHVFGRGNRNPRISLEAHAAGAVCGLCFGFCLYRRFNTSSNEQIEL